MSALAPPIQQRPRIVVLAVCFMGVYMAASLMRLALMYTWPRPRPITAFLALSIVIGGLLALWLYGLWSRRNGVRWLTIIVGAGNLLLLSRGFAQVDESARIFLVWAPAQAFLLWVQIAATAAAAGLLLTRQARNWYGRRAGVAAKELSTVLELLPVSPELNTSWFSRHLGRVWVPLVICAYVGSLVLVLQLEPKEPIACDDIQILGVGKCSARSSCFAVRYSNTGDQRRVATYVLRPFDISYVGPAALCTLKGGWTGVHYFELKHNGGKTV
jgi:hypothetical protein